jgi:organic radical activating enzyme
MVPERIVLSLTEKCNFACGHCSLESSPRKHKTLNKNLINKVIEEAFFIPSIQSIDFSGGEATLYPDLLEEGIKLATEKGFETSLTTNCWWAKTAKNSEEILKNLADAGLKEITVSYDIFHAPYLSMFGGEENIINAVRTAILLNLKVYINVCKYPKEKITDKYIRRLILNENIKGDISIISGDALPLGRAKLKQVTDFFIDGYNSQKNDSGACLSVGRIVNVLPDGNVIFCCGHAVNKKTNNFFVLGNIATHNLSMLINQMQKNALCWWLYIKGPESLLQELGEMAKKYKYCVACYELATTYSKELLTFSKEKEKIIERLKGS